MTTMETRHRMKVMMAIIVLQVCLGGLYAWSILFPFLRMTWHTATATVTAFAAIMLSFGFTMWVLNRIVLYLKTTMLCVVSAVLMAAGPLFVMTYPDAYVMYTISGILTGAGVAVGMAIPRRAIMDTFTYTDDQQLLTRTVSIAFGAAAFLMAPLFVRLIEHGMMVHFVGTTLINTGALLAAAWWLRHTHGKQFSPTALPLIRRQISATGKLMFTIATCAGLSVIAVVAMLIISQGANMITAGAFVGLLGLANGAGRVVGFLLLNRVRLNSAIAIAAIVQAIGLILMASSSIGVFRVAAAVTLIGMGYGMLIAVTLGTTQAPLVSMAYNITDNCELLFGTAGVIGPIGVALTMDIAGNAWPWLQFMAYLSVGCAVLTLVIDERTA